MLVLLISGKQLIQTCLNSPDPGDVANPSSHHDDQRMSAQGFEEPELTYAPTDDTKVSGAFMMLTSCNYDMWMINYNELHLKGL